MYLKNKRVSFVAWRDWNAARISERTTIGLKVNTSVQTDLRIV